MNRNSYTVRAFDVTSVTAFLTSEFESGFFQSSDDFARPKRLKRHGQAASLEDRILL